MVVAAPPSFVQFLLAVAVAVAFGEEGGNYTGTISNDVVVEPPIATGPSVVVENSSASAATDAIAEFRALDTRRLAIYAHQRALAAFLKVRASKMCCSLHYGGVIYQLRNEDNSIHYGNSHGKLITLYIVLLCRYFIVRAHGRGHAHTRRCASRGCKTEP